MSKILKRSAPFALITLLFAGGCDPIPLPGSGSGSGEDSNAEGSTAPGSDTGSGDTGETTPGKTEGSSCSIHGVNNLCGEENPHLFCNYPVSAACGATGQAGVCERPPADCLGQASDPVCGCDNKTYDNTCMAAMAKSSVRSKGACPTTGPACGGRLGDTCNDTQYCAFSLADTCGWADATALCEARPDACNKAYVPVCGCDNKTYGNECMANAAGTAIVSHGPCKDSPKPGPADACGGLLGNTCAPSQFCNFSRKDICGHADATALCAPRPNGCTKEYKPVCGCDDKTYSNECLANLQGVAALHDGTCEDAAGKGGKVGDRCGGESTLPPCGPKLFCAYRIEDKCGHADETGQCAARPEACIDVYEPVCGCDGKTYGNGCYAAAQGVSVKGKGACE